MVVMFVKISLKNCYNLVLVKNNKLIVVIKSIIIVFKFGCIKISNV